MNDVAKVGGDSDKGKEVFFAAPEWAREEHCVFRGRKGLLGKGVGKPSEELGHVWRDEVFHVPAGAGVDDVSEGESDCVGEGSTFIYKFWGGFFFFFFGVRFQRKRR